MSDDSLLEALRQAIALHQAGQWHEAERLYLSILQIAPGHPDVHHNLGILAQQSQHTAKALDYFKQALAADPDQGKFWHSYIQALIQAELYGEARRVLQQGKTQVGLQGQAIDDLTRQLASPSDEEIRQLKACYDRGLYAVSESLARLLLVRFPEQGLVWKSLGLSLLKLERQTEAAVALEQSIRWQPDDADAHIQYASTLFRLGQPEAAIAAYRQALQIDPANAKAHQNLAVILHNQGQITEAESHLRRATELRPDEFDPLINLGLNLQSQGRASDAERCFRRAIALNPDIAGLHHFLSIALKMQGRSAEAEYSCRQALQFDPHHAEAHGNLGAIYFDRGLYAAAETCFSNAVTIKPDYAEAYNNLGTVQQIQRRFLDAEANYRQAIALNPVYAEAHTNLGINLQSQGRIPEAEACWRTSLNLNPHNIPTQSGLVFHLSYSARLPKSDYLAEAKKYGRMVAGIATPYTAWRCDPQPQRLKVGLVSGDFRNHPVGHFLHSLLRRIDTTRIDLIAYATQPGTDSFSEALRPYFADWKVIASHSDAMAAQMIHADGIHILVDVAGHSAHNRLPLFAWKPAPIQASWLGYLASTGVEAIDYVLSDPYTIRPEDEQYFTESIWRLPDSCICFTPTTQSLEIPPLPALQTGIVTFGSFNNLAKMGDDVVALWSRILHKVPASRLLLKAGQLKEPLIRSRTLQRFAAHGITSERLLLCETVPDAAEHLLGYHQIDIALDTFPYPGVTTSVEALWMGVPVLTLQGDGILGRAGESININAGQTDWIAADETDFVTKAAFFAENRAALAQLRQTLRTKLSSSLVFDSIRFAQHFDAALWGMWQNRNTPG